jgi:hypothetical protein
MWGGKNGQYCYIVIGVSRHQVFPSSRCRGFDERTLMQNSDTTIHHQLKQAIRKMTEVCNFTKSCKKAITPNAGAPVQL